MMSVESGRVCRFPSSSSDGSLRIAIQGNFPPRRLADGTRFGLVRHACKAEPGFEFGDEGRPGEVSLVREAAVEGDFW